MKFKSAVIFFWAFFVVGCVSTFAQQKMYLSFVKDSDGGHLYQSSTPVGTSIELKSINETALQMNAILKAFEGDLYFESDIDLGQIDAAGSCVVNHTPLTFKKSGGKIFGNGHVISNMCAKFFTKDNFSQYGLTRDTLGFFKILDGVTVRNLKFENVNFSVTEGEKHSSKFEEGHLYAPTGTLAGIVKNSSIDSIYLTSVKITSPIAGGVAGFAANASFSNIFSTDQIVLNNESVINNKSKNAAVTGIGSLGGGEYSVYLGGLAGFSLNLSISNVDVSVSAQNDASDTTVALGGLVGQYSFFDGEAYGYVAKDKYVVENVNVGVNEKSSFANGAAMGGLFGVVSVLKNEKGFVDVVVVKSSFSGSFGNVQGDTGYVAGFIARNLLDRGMSVKIIEGKSEVDVDDTMKNSQMNAYYVGGFIGWSSLNYNGDLARNLDAFVSFVESKALGSFNLHNPSSAEKICLFAGGFLGFGALAMNDSALIYDTSFVDIDVNVKSKNADTTAVGGFVGFLENKGKTGDLAYVKVQKSLYSGAIRVKNSTNKVYAGGIAGIYYGIDNVHTLFMDNVSILGANSINVSADNAFVGGVIGHANTVSSLDKIAVTGNIVVKDVKDSLLAGGLFGYLFSSTMNFNWTNSYYIGGLSLEGSISSKATVLAGYLAGSVSMKGNNYAHVIHSCYHGGSDDLEAFGRISEGSTALSDWKNISTKCDGNTLCWDVHHIVRNGETESLNSRFNGTQVLAKMQSTYFVDFLNESNDKKLWMQDDGENDKYPFFDGGNVGNIDMSSSSSFESSSSVESSSSEEEPESSSSEKVPAESSSSAEEPESSSSEKVPAESSSSAEEPESSSSEKVPAESSSSTEEPESSSSEKVPAESSSSAEEPESSSSEKVPAESSSSAEVPNESSSSEDVLPESSSSVVDFAWYSSSSVNKSWRWRMVSLAQLENVSLEGEEVLYWWDESCIYGEYLQYKKYDSQNKGENTRGYWIWSNREFAKNVVNDVSVKSFVWNVDSIHSGWNLVANPYGWPVSLSNLPEDVQVWRWLDGKMDYDTVTVLRPYEGVWVHSGSRKSIIVDATPVDRNAVVAVKKQSEMSPTDWNARVILHDSQGVSDSRNILGVGSRTERWVEPPSGMGNNRVKLSFVEGEKRYAKLQKRSTDNLEWTLQMNASSDRDGFLEFEGLESLAGSGKNLYVIDDGKVTEMKPGKSVRVALKSYAKNVTVMASETAPVLSSKAVYDFHVNLDHQVNVDFKVVKSYSNKPIQIVLVNALGSKIFSSEISTGLSEHQVQLGIPQKGVYFLAVKVGNDVATRRIVVR